MRLLVFITLLFIFVSCKKHKPETSYSEFSSKTDSTGNPIYQFHIPGSFTPDGDGVNEEFKPAGYGFENDYLLEIYDRSSRVFLTTHVNRGWDGRVNYGGVIGPGGTYTYYFSFTDITGESHKRSGNVIMLR